MSRRGPLVVAALSLAALGLLWALGAPAHAGAIANLGEPGPGAALGLLWLVVHPACVLMVPALLITAAAEALHAIWTRPRAGTSRPGLGSLSGPGDTSGGE